MNTNILLIEDNIIHFNSIKKILENFDFNVYPELNNGDNSRQLKSTLFGYYIETGDDKKNVESIKNTISNYLASDELYKKIDIIILDLFLINNESKSNNSIESVSGYKLFKYIRQEFTIDSFGYEKWGKLVPIIILTKEELSAENSALFYNENIFVNDFFEKNDIIEDDKDQNIISNFLNKIKIYSSYFKTISKLINNNNKPKIDIAVISALEEEMAPFRTLLGKENKNEIINSFPFLKYIIKNAKGKNISILTGVQKEMGMFDASYLISNILMNYEVKHIFMIGVCGGNGQDVNIGDLIIPKAVKLFSKGKITSKKFKADIDTANNNSPFYSVVSKNSNEVLATILSDILEGQDFKKFKSFIQSRDKDHPKIDLYSKSMGCSDYVIDQENLLDSLKEFVSDRKLISADTESFPVIKVGERWEDLKTDVIKSVMDLTNNKSDKYKDVAAYISARFLYEILVQGIYPID